MIVLDHTSIPALPRHQVLADFAASAPRDDRDRVVIPLLCASACLPGPDREEAGFAQALGQLIGVDFEPLDFAAFEHIERLTAAGLPWQAAHAAHVVLASGPQAHDRHDQVLITTQPALYKGLGITAIDLADL